MSPLACDLTAIPVAERAAHQDATRLLVASAIEIHPSGEGFTLKLPAGRYELVAQFVARERLCCPFLKFVIAVAPESGLVELRLTGPAGSREFIRHELRLP